MLEFFSRAAGAYLVAVDFTSAIDGAYGEVTFRDWAVTKVRGHRRANSLAHHICFGGTEHRPRRVGRAESTAHEVLQFEPLLTLDDHAVGQNEVLALEELVGGESRHLPEITADPFVSRC